MAGIRPLSDCGGVCGTGAGVVLVAGNPPLPVRCPIQWVVWFVSLRRQFLARQLLLAAACLGERRVAAAGIQSQASLYKLPQPLYVD